MNPYLAATVLVNVDAAHNNGQPVAPAVITALNADGTVNVRVLYDSAPPLFGEHHHRQEHLTDVAFHDTTDPAAANRQGLYGAFWPAAPAQQDLTHIEQILEKTMTVQNDIDTAATTIQSAVSAIQATAADLTSAASAIQSEIASLNSQISAGGGTPVDTSALDSAVSALSAAVAPLQQAQAAVDALEPAAPAPAEPAPAEAAESAPADGTAGSTVDAGDTGSAA